jgi:phage terminase small subunit
MGKHNQSHEEFIRSWVHRGNPALLAELELTDRERVFCEEYLSNGFNRNKSAFKAVNSSGAISKHPITNGVYWSQQAYKFLQIDRVKNYLKAHTEEMEIKLGNPISIDSVVEVLGDILHNDEATHKDRIKAGEILLKHLNAFSAHNESKASKQLTVINGMTPSQVDDELTQAMKKLSMDKPLKDDNITEVETIEE